MKRGNKKGQNMSVGTIIAIVILLVLAVLVILQLVFGINLLGINLFPRADTNVDIIVQTCDTKCDSGSVGKYEYCCVVRDVMYDADQEFPESDTCDSDSRLGSCDKFECDETVCEQAICGTRLTADKEMYYKIYETMKLDSGVEKTLDKYFRIKFDVVVRDECDGLADGDKKVKEIETDSDGDKSEKEVNIQKEIFLDRTLDDDMKPLERGKVCCLVEVGDPVEITVSGSQETEIDPSDADAVGKVEAKINLENLNEI
ncbi:MAG: hypothetical protein KKF56_04000 [Nanoarchaeota archaeon]|nr:hypothetical protein [Nanoarchaeota archaeon]